MPDIQIPGLPAATAAADDDLLMMRDTSETEDVKLTLAQLVSLYGLLKNPATTDGDLITRASGVMARLPIGGAGTVLTSTGTAIEWADVKIVAESELSVTGLANDTYGDFTGGELTLDDGTYWITIGAVVSVNYSGTPTHSQHFLVLTDISNNTIGSEAIAGGAIWNTTSRVCSLTTAFSYTVTGGPKTVKLRCKGVLSGGTFDSAAGSRGFLSAVRM